MSEDIQRSRSVAVAAHPVHWVICGLLAVIAIALWVRPGSDALPSAFAQTSPLAGARGVFAFTGPIDQNRYGLFMLDVDQGTIWCYELDTVGGTRKLRLIAARTWNYDRFLQDFNCAAPSFRDVQQLVTQQRAAARAANDDRDRVTDGASTVTPPRE